MERRRFPPRISLDRRRRRGRSGSCGDHRGRAGARDPGGDAGGHPQGGGLGPRQHGQGQARPAAAVENGNAVPLTVSVESPMTEADHVKAIHVFTEKNPQPDVVSIPPRAARRARARGDAHPPRRHADRRRDLRAERRLVLVRARRRRRDARRVPGGGLAVASALVNVPARARRGEVIEIKTLVSHPMETGIPPHPARRADPARHHPALRLHLQRHGGLPRRPPPGDRRQSLLRLLDGRDRERHHRVPLDRRQRLLGDGVGRHHRRLSAAALGRCWGRWRWRRRPSPSRLRAADRRSGYDFMSRETRAMQDDDTANPGLLWVLEGETLWSRKAGAAGRACADCHGDARDQHEGRGRALSGVRRRQGTAGQSRAAHQSVPHRPAAGAAARLGKPRAAGADRLRRAPVARPADRHRDRPAHAAVPRRRPRHLGSAPGPAQPRVRQCHDDNWGRQLAGNVIPQAHPTGYPLYRLEWQGLGSLQRRLRNCLVGIRAEPYDYGAPELVDLELFLMWRARGMTLEAPAVRP